MRGALASLACALLLAGCGFGAGDEQAGGASLRVTRDFGRAELGSVSTDTLREDQTVMRLLRSEFEVDTRFGGRFVQAIDGVAGEGASGRRDWFFFVNGLEADVGAAEYELSPGDRVQWDLRHWEAAMRVPAIVGAFPEPFRSGTEGERRPVRVECEEAQTEPCREAKEALQSDRRAGVRLLARRARHRDRHPARRGALARGSHRARCADARGGSGGERRVRALGPPGPVARAARRRRRGRADGAARGRHRARGRAAPAR